MEEVVRRILIALTITLPIVAILSNKYSLAQADQKNLLGVAIGLAVYYISWGAFWVLVAVWLVHFLSTVLY